MAEPKTAFLNLILPVWREINIWLSYVCFGSAGFNRKVIYRIRTDRRELLVRLSDKQMFKEYVQEVAGTGYTLPTLSEVTSVEEYVLPTSPFVCRSVHGSGANILVGPHGLANCSEPVAPLGQKWENVYLDVCNYRTYDWSGHFNFYLNRRFAGKSREIEWAYTGVTPRFILEPFLMGANGQPPLELKFFVFSGRIEFINVFVGGSNLFDRPSLVSPGLLVDRNFNRVSFGKQGANPKEQLLALPQLPDIFPVVEKVSAGLEFLRVDVLVGEDLAIISEAAVYPMGGRNWFHPFYGDMVFGKKWK